MPLSWGTAQGGRAFRGSGPYCHYNPFPCVSAAKGAEGGHWTEREIVRFHSEGSGWSVSGTCSIATVSGVDNVWNTLSMPLKGNAHKVKNYSWSIFKIVFKSTLAPLQHHSTGENSSSQWLCPPLLGTKIMVVGTISLKYWAS